MAANISREEFELRLARQKGSNQNTLSWKELKEGGIYEITNFEFIDTKYGKACIITLNDGSRYFTPSTLYDRLKTVDPDKHLPCLLRPLAKKKSKTSGNFYWDYDLVFSNY